jgi:hypothetical protein
VRWIFLVNDIRQTTTEPPNVRALGGHNTSISPPFPLQTPVPLSPSCNNDPLTLSQISPRRISAPSEDRDLALAPTFSGESSRKRAIEDDGPRVRKKRKPDVPASFSVAPAALQPTVQNAVLPTSKRALVKTRDTLRQELTFKGKEREDVTSSGSTSNTSQPKPKGRPLISNHTRSAAGFQRVTEKPVSLLLTERHKPLGTPNYMLRLLLRAPQNPRNPSSILHLTPIPILRAGKPKLTKSRRVYGIAAISQSLTSRRCTLSKTPCRYVVRSKSFLFFH